MTESKDEEEETISETNSIRFIHKLRSKQRNFESPINLNIAQMEILHLQPLIWHHHDLPCKKMKLLNSGHTLILSAKWFEERPFLTGGPLTGNYVFSQLHFHWGATDMEGSEHTVDGTQYPVEMHVVHFKSCYLTQEAALKEKDGMAVCVYFFKLQSQSNPLMQIVLDSAKQVKKAGAAVKMERLPLSTVAPSFSNDYFMYWGSIATSNCIHMMMWLVAREPIGISAKQVDVFRKLLDQDDTPILRNFRYAQMPSNKAVYHINPSTMRYATLLPIPRSSVKTKKKRSRASKEGE